MAQWLYLLLVMVTVGDQQLHSTAHESVDLIELNHFHDDAGRPVYDQVIFYEWSTGEGKYHVRAWCLVEPKDPISRRPSQTFSDNRYHVRWFDSDQNIKRHISSGLFRESWTQSDPERANKKILDERNRTALYKRPSKSASEKPVDEEQPTEVASNDQSNAEVALR
jgi:hypothetical protein